MEFSPSRSNGLATLRIAGELDAVTTPDLRQSPNTLVVEQHDHIVVDLSGLRPTEGLSVGAVVFLYKRAKEGGRVMTMHGLCDQPLAVTGLLCMEDNPAGARLIQHVARGYLHLNAKIGEKPRPPVATVEGR